jgi:protein-tyrosine phosphatase
VADRLIPLEGPANFRDLGGYETDHGRFVRTGRVFRSDSLSFMSEGDVAHVTEVLHLRTVIDLRAAQEVERFTHGPLETLETLPVTVWHVPIVDETRRNDSGHAAEAWSNGEVIPLDDLYLLMLNRFGHRFAAVLDLIAADDTQPVVFHCAAGKDRTGILAALLLSTLGVPDDLIVADYEISEHALAPSFAWAEANDGAMAAALSKLAPWQHRSSPERMRVFLDRLGERHGSIQGYLRDAGLEAEVLEALRARLLEP